MEQVWKFPFPIPIQDDFALDMPKDAQVLAIMVQRDQPCLWARVWPESQRVRRYFKLRGTGHKVGPDCGKHVGSFMTRGDALVFHVFEAL